MGLMSLIARGYTAKSVMDALVHRYPQHEKKIKAATAAGFGYDTVARYMDKNKGSPDDYLTEHEKAVKSNRDNRRNRAVGIAAGAAGLAAGAGYLYANRNQGVVYPSQITGGPGSATATSGSGGPKGGLPNQPQGLIPYNPQGNRSVTPAQPQQGTPPTNVIPSGPVIVPPYEHNPTKNVGLVRNIREDKRIAQALASGLSMPAVIDHLRNTLPKGKLALLDRAPGGLEQVLEDFNAARRSEHSEENRVEALQRFKQGQQKPPTLREQELERFQQGYGPKQAPVEPPQQAAQVQPEMAQAVQQAQASQPTPAEGIEAPQQAMQAAQEELQLAQDISKPIVQEIKKQGEEQRKQTEKLEGVDIPSILKNMVMTPQGVLELKHRGKDGVIGKTEGGSEKSFKPQDIEDVEDHEDVMKAVQDILQIPEVDRSSNIALFLYNPKDREMYFQFHDGSAYKYYDVDEDKVFRLANKMAIPITQGENVYGAWSQDDRASLGAAFWQEIQKDPKYAKPKKGEPPNPNYYRMQTLYDYWKQLRKQPKRRKKNV